MKWRHCRLISVLLCAALSYGIALEHLRQVKPDPSPELLLAMPRIVQVVLTGGDRYLAANLAGFRVLVTTSSRMNPEDYVVQARLQKDVAWFNAAHEDNYYVAAATLPWNAHVDDAQDVLRRAAAKRTFDWQPLFYLGFGYYYFLKDPATGAKLLLDGSLRATDQQDIWALQNLAARWIERGYDGRTAAGLVQAMAENSPSGSFRNYLTSRAERIRALEDIRDAVGLYQARFGKRPDELLDLTRSGVLERLPKDPFGVGFILGPDGEPIVRPNQ